MADTRISKEEETSSSITVRVIRSLQHKNWKPLVIRNVPLDRWTLKDLRLEIEERLRASGFPPPFTRDLTYYDSIKLETNPCTNHSKSSNALINTSTPTIRFKRDELLLQTDSVDDKVSLSLLGLSHECEVSLFNSTDYDAYLLTLTNQ